MPTFGQYELLEKLGQGGMGVIYKARKIGGEGFVAIKVINPECNASPNLIQRFELEARSVAKLSHPNIIKIFEHGIIGSHRYYAMEYIDGHSLRKQMTIQWPDLHEVLSIVRDMALALDHAHSKGICHRDVKPENILIDKNGHVYLTDFGLAKDYSPGASSLTGAGVIVGTPNYMAPEQADSLRYGKVGPQTDIYALGIIMYELLTGHVPFKADNLGNPFFEVAIKIIRESVRKISEFNPKVPKEIEAICMKSLEKDPGKRYNTAGEMAQVIDIYFSKNKIEFKKITTTKKKEESVGGFSNLLKVENVLAGTLYQARQRSINREVTLKIVYPRNFGNEKSGTYESFHKMISTLSQINHPSLLPIYETGSTGGYFYYATQLINGEPLFDLPLKLKFPIYQGVELFLDLLELLDIIHSKEIVHGNIQPASIIYSGSSLKLIHFGSKVWDICYISPEQAKGEPYDGRSDIFSLGAVMAEFFSGKKVFCEEQEKSVVSRSKFIELGKKRLNDLFSTPETRGLGVILDKCIQGYRNKRYQKAEHVLKDLEAYKLSLVNNIVATLPQNTIKSQHISIPGKIFWLSPLLAILFFIMVFIGTLFFLFHNARLVRSFLRFLSYQ